MKIVRVALIALVVVSLTRTLTAEQFYYGETKPAGLTAERFTGKKCQVFVYGPTGGSYVKGVYNEPQGELEVSSDRLSSLSVSGRANKVVVMFVDLNSSVDLTDLKIGKGGVEIHSVNRRSKVEIGECDGPVIVKSVEGSTVTVTPGTKVTGRNRFFDGAQLLFEKPN